jgi:hypothetical protein
MYSVVFTYSTVQNRLNTDTKMNGQFRAPAWMSVIKLLLAGNTISFCGLNKLFAIAGSSPGIFENSLCVPVSKPSFSKKLPYPNPEYLKWFSVLVPRPEFFGIVPFPSLELSGKSGHFQARKTASTWDQTTDLLITKQMSYPYTTSSYKFHFLFYQYSKLFI